MAFEFKFTFCRGLKTLHCSNKVRTVCPKQDLGHLQRLRPVGMMDKTQNNSMNICIDVFRDNPVRR